MDYMPLYKIMPGDEPVQVNVTAIESFYRFFLGIKYSIEEHDYMYDKFAPQEHPYTVHLKAYNYAFNEDRESKVIILRNECNIPCVQNFTTMNQKAGSLRMLPRNLERAYLSSKKQLEDINHRIAKYSHLERKFNATTSKERQIEARDRHMKENGMFLLKDQRKHKHKRKSKRKQNKNIKIK